jgi:FAD/FMN-containing dehydrogenase/Fe-S oxidoreductase
MQPAGTVASELRALAASLEGDLYSGDLARAVYATDASEYQQRPLAVALPKTEADIGRLVRFAAAEGTPLVPRAAGTSLAGQVVGSGIVVDVGRHMNRILGVDLERRQVRVQPGVIRDDLNRFLAPHGLFFAPETSTAGWAMIGGMVGNNSCGANSIAYGSTREHIVGLRGYLADGSVARFGPLSTAEFAAKCEGPDSLETRIHRGLRDLLGRETVRREIREGFPRPEVTRRNTGYALDALLESSCFADDDGSSKEARELRPLNLCRLLAGSEGTLVFGVEYELQVIPLPPPGALMVVHCGSVDEALRATLVVMRGRPADGPACELTACELIDDKILACTKDNPEQARNRSFVVGDPGAVLVVELKHADPAVIAEGMADLETRLREAGLGYAFPVLRGEECSQVWELRRAGQGLVNNLPGDAKPREIVEDTAVAVEDLPAYIAEFDRLLNEKYGIDCVHYAHAGAGELHLRPLFDLHSPEGLAMFRQVASDVAALVRKYRGSLSGEHGDGRLRGEFIREMVGEACYRHLVAVKRLFDPAGIFNPGKIVDAPAMDTSLRVTPGRPRPVYETLFRFADTGGVLRAAERCTGVGQCRKPPAAGGTMCPSYMATRDEQDSTRARATLLRQLLSEAPGATSPWTRPELAEALELCLSCKACKSECPSNVDMARLKAEVEQQRHDRLGVPWRTRLVAHFATAMRQAAAVPRLSNFLITAPGVSHLLKAVMGFAQRRSLPTLPSSTLTAWQARRPRPERVGPRRSRVFFFRDEFTDTLDAGIGIRAVELLEALGYEVVFPEHAASGRAEISKGLLREARSLAVANVVQLEPIVSDAEPLVGVEPSAILGFRDEYPDLVPEPQAAAAGRLAGRALLIDEFLAREAAAGRITPDDFDTTSRQILLHGHCHQKAIGSLAATVEMLSLPRGHEVELIPSGCCGMAGSFGYDRRHYDLSMRIGEMVLFPAVRAAPAATLIAAGGTSCRHQIIDGTSRRSLHPVEILHAAVLPRAAT